MNKLFYIPIVAGSFLLVPLAIAQSQSATEKTQSQNSAKEEQVKQPESKQTEASKQSDTAKQPERIAVSDLKKKLDSGEKMLLIDVREDWELKQDGAIPGAIHIPVGELDARMKDIPKDVQLVFY